MDMEKFCDKILNDETIADIPVDFVFRIVFSVFSILASGECFYSHELD